MPKTIIDYSKTIMYKIVSNDLEITDCYVGSTSDFTKRKWAHKAGCTKEQNRAYMYNVYVFIRNNGGWDNFSMVEIEKFPCIDGNESRSRERFWIEKLNATLNKVIPGRTRQETCKAFRDANIDTIHIQDKIYRQNNIEEIKRRKAEYTKNNREKINIYQRALRARNKAKCSVDTSSD